MSSEMRPEVERLLELGPLPADSEAMAEPLKLKEFQERLDAVGAPVTLEEARALLTLFGRGDGFGLAWTLLHVIETAPALPIDTEPPPDANEWVRELWSRAHR